MTRAGWRADCPDEVSTIPWTRHGPPRYFRTAALLSASRANHLDQVSTTPWTRHGPPRYFHTAALLPYYSA